MESGKWKVRSARCLGLMHVIGNRAACICVLAALALLLGGGCMQTVVADEAKLQLGPPTDVAFKARVDRTEQHYIERLPAGFDKTKTHDVLIALHGHGSDRWQFATNETYVEILAMRAVAAKYQMIYICPDYRATTSWMGPKAEADVVQIIRDLRRKYRVGKVFLTGGSMGGSSALTFTALHPDLIAGVCSMNGTANHLEYENFQEFIAESFGGTKKAIPLEYKKRSAEYWPEKFTMPVAITLGGQDTTVPPQSALRLANVLEKMGRQVLLIYRPDGGHGTNYEDAVQALEWVLEKNGVKATTSP